MWRGLGLLTLALCGTADAFWWLENRGSCPDDVQKQEDFQKDRFMGRWFEINTTGHAHHGRKCVTVEYTSSGNSTFEVNITANYTIKRRWMQSETVVKSTVFQATIVEDDPAIFTVAQGDKEESTEYMVLDTDYESYAVIYSCREHRFWFFGTFHQKELVVLGRTAELEEETEEEIRDVLGEQHSDMVSFMHATNQSCFMQADQHQNDED